MMKEEGEMTSADALVPRMVLVVARAALQRAASTQAFVDEFLDADGRADEMYCLYVNFQCAVAYVAQLEPRCALVRVPLRDETLPAALTDRVAAEEYNKLLSPLRTLVAGTRFGRLRAEGAGVGGSIGAAAGVLVAAGATVLSLGAALPLAIGAVAAGTAIGSAAGGALPWRRRRVFADLAERVAYVNTVLEPRFVTLVDPVLTNRLGPSSSISAVTDIEWIVKSLDS